RLLERDGCASPSGSTAGPGIPPFRGGWIGYYGYDVAPLLERLPRKAPPDSRMPVLRFALYDWAASIDHATGSAVLSVFDLHGEGGLEARRRDLRRLLHRAVARREMPTASRLDEPPRSLVGREDF